MNVLFLTAVPSESTEFLQTLHAKSPLTPHPVLGVESCLKQSLGDNNIFFAHTSIGTEDAAITATTLIPQIKPDCIFMCGTAGGAKSTLNVGDIVVGNEIIHLDLYSIHEILRGTAFEEALVNPNTKNKVEISWPADSQLLSLCKNIALPNIYVDKIFTSNTFPSPPHIFDAIKTLGGGAIEMESSGICRAAKRMGNIPTISIRVISNLLDDKGNDRGTPDGAINVCAKRLSDFLMAIVSQKIK